MKPPVVTARRSRVLAVGLCGLVSISAWAADLTVPNTFTANTPALAVEVNQNFSATAAAVNSKQDRVTGTCPAGQAIQTVNANGTVTCQASQNPITGACPLGQAVQSVNADGSVVCQRVSFFGGSGTAGDLAVATSVNWSGAPPANPNFANVTIGTGQTLTVPAGTTIRCSGSFTNNGTLSVLPGAESEGAFTLSSVVSGADQLTAVIHPGDTPGSASLGQSASDATGVILRGGRPGKAIPRAVALTSFGNFRIGGGSGAGYDNQGGQGGGLVRIYCDGLIVNNGTITARGSNASNASIGGGGGGIVVLASRTRVDNTNGTIDVSGGNALPAQSFGGNGGGGGGGVVIMVSPQTPLLGTEVVAGGTGGAGATLVVTASRTAGAGGGGSGGQGGIGGQVGNTGTPSTGGNGAPGYVITLTDDPLAMAH